MSEKDEIQELALRTYWQIVIRDYLSQEYYGKIPYGLENRMHELLVKLNSASVPSEQDFRDLARSAIDEFKSEHFVRRTTGFEELKKRMDILYRHFRRLANASANGDITMAQGVEMRELANWFNSLRKDYNRLGLPFLFESKFKLSLPGKYDYGMDEEEIAENVDD